MITFVVEMFLVASCVVGCAFIWLVVFWAISELLGDRW